MRFDMLEHPANRGGSGMLIGGIGRVGWGEGEIVHAGDPAEYPFGDYAQLPGEGAARKGPAACHHPVHIEWNHGCERGSREYDRESLAEIMVEDDQAGSREGDPFVPVNDQWNSGFGDDPRSVVVKRPPGSPEGIQ